MHTPTELLEAGVELYKFTDMKEEFTQEEANEIIGWLVTKKYVIRRVVNNDQEDNSEDPEGEEEEEEKESQSRRDDVQQETNRQSSQLINDNIVSDIATVNSNFIRRYE